ncbi:MAG TPA: XrtN system VIT domain-containing protein, partial [Flavisolibacter sp.]|nr:XrtN system VIT domain-containing protein [Flavisolibacter sp.]
PNSFSFNGSRYSVQPYQPQRVPAQITDVYLDINRSWSKEDFARIWKEVTAKKVWVYAGDMTALTSANKDSLFASLQKQSFSLFPFYLVKKPEHSLVVSQSGAYSPTLSDLDGSPFLASLQKRFGRGQRVRLFHFGADLSPYIRSLKERRYFDFETGDPALLRSLLAKQVFVQDAETDNTVVVHSAGVVVTKQAGDTASNAPDHLLRLFAYNHILQQLGRKDPTAADSTALVKEAGEAYVVSPVSSLVVLETAEDYEHFGIKDSENSLKNAGIKGKGAVPEPGEWAIIILVGAFFIFFLLKSKLV